MANITATENAYAIATIIAAEALGYLKSNTVLARLVSRDWDNEVATYGQTVRITKRGTLSVNDKAENSNITLQTPTLSKYDVTLNKHKEVSFVLEDFGRVLSRPNLLSGYMEDGIKAIGEQIDSDLAALYAGLSQTIDATTGMNEEDFRNARRLLNAAKAPLMDRYAVLHEDAEYEMLGIERVVNSVYAQSLGAGVLADAYTGKFAGFQTFMDQKIAVADGVCKNLFFHKNALVLATRPMPMDGNGAGVVQTAMDEDGVGLRITMSYDHDKLGWKVTIDVLYGVAELLDNHGVVVSTGEI